MVFFDWDSTRLSPASLNVLEQARDSFNAKQGWPVAVTRCRRLCRRHPGAREGTDRRQDRAAAAHLIA
jgi:hypothetical protein